MLIVYNIIIIMSVPIVDDIQVYNTKGGVWGDTGESPECRQGLLTR